MSGEASTQTAAEQTADGTQPAGTPDGGEPSAPLYAIGDTHGHLTELDASLRDAGLIDADGAWTGENATVWFLGDFTDRGPDGIGVIDRVRDLANQAHAAGGHVGALLGNHELLLAGTHRFADEIVPITYPERSFRMVWLINGGKEEDLDRFTDEHLEWLLNLDVVTLAGDNLLMHSDTTSYISYGHSVAEINDAVRQVLRGDSIEDWWLCFRRLTARHEFHGDHGEQTANDILEILGGERIVHGHSTIPSQLGVDPASVTEPYEYAGGKALAIDGGVYLGGPCLVVRLN